METALQYAEQVFVGTVRRAGALTSRWLQLASRLATCAICMEEPVSLGRRFGERAPSV